MIVKNLVWRGDALDILDQRLLPHQSVSIRCETAKDVARAIKDMAVRGAPAIGDAAAFGVALAARERPFLKTQDLLSHVKIASVALGKTRPTAVNLFWALKRMERSAEEGKALGVPQLQRKLLAEAFAIMDEDIAANKAIGQHGAKLFKKPSNFLTHCNAGALATAGYGTATSVFYFAFDQKKLKKVFVDETRPYLQGARLTAWELQKSGLPVELITDSMAGHFMKQGEVDAVIVGADRVAANGDVANKIGTYSLAVLAQYHKIPFYVAAPTSTIDLATKSGKDIPIEERSSAEVTNLNGISIAPINTIARHPAFDVTPSQLVTGIITERGVARAPYAQSLSKILSIH